jgi:hypothetical protein
MNKTMQVIKKLTGIAVLMAAMIVVAACSHTETYQEKRDKEISAINSFIAEKNVKVISEETFFAHDSFTDVSKNEFVLFDNTGVYLQIVRKGCGSPIANGETTSVLCRFKEYNILTDSLILTNEVMKLSYLVDKMNVTRTSDSFTASFVEGVMFTQYQSASVPAGWLVPLLYINVGRLEKEEDEIAKVNIIVPHSQGHQSAVTGVYPCYYEITYQISR